LKQLKLLLLYKYSLDAKEIAILRPRDVEEIHPRDRLRSVKTT